MTTLATESSLTGYPHASMFPIGKLSFDVCTPDSSQVQQRSIGTGLDGSDFVPTHLSSGKAKVPTSNTSLYPFLQYGPTEGDARLRAFCKDLVRHLHSPPSPSWDLSMCAGGGAAIELILRLLCNAGDWVLFDEFTYPATLECATSQRLRLRGVPVDEEGMCPKALREVLVSWDEAKDGKRPLVLCEWAGDDSATKIQSD
jgi:DNA-binding transcriptional MocR family regulator